MDIVSDRELEAKLDGLRHNGGTEPLAALTPFVWDTVYLYREGATADEINTDVGAEVLRPGTRLMITGVLAVFVKDGKAVKALGILRELSFAPGRQPDGVVVQKGFRLQAPAAG